MKLPKGLSEITIKGIINDKQTKTTANSIIENAFYRITVKPDGTFDIFDKSLETWVAVNVGKFEHAYTNSMQIREEEHPVRSIIYFMRELSAEAL